MNIYVCIKQVPDTETKIKLTGDNGWIETTGVKWIMSPFDEFAVEEALRLKEKNPGSTVVAVSAGPARQCIVLQLLVRSTIRATFFGAACLGGGIDKASGALASKPA